MNVLYDISLEIDYTYAMAGDAGRHVLRMLPLNLPGEQRVIAAALSVTPSPSEQVSRYDFFGNQFIEIDFAGLQQEIIFNARARVERQLTHVPMDLSIGLDALRTQVAIHRDLGPMSPLHFLNTSPYITLHDEITEFSRGLVTPGATVMSIAESVGAALFESMTYDPEATDVDTPIVEAFNNRHGVCQDYSHIMIAALRGIGIPAAYVSGFLRTNTMPGEPGLEGADAMHAWVRIWCGLDAGWFEYDPTNRLFATRDHVVIARGRDYGDVSPVKGLMRMFGERTSEQRVTVKLLE